MILFRSILDITASLKMTGVEIPSLPCRALEAAGVIYIDRNGEGPGVRLRKRPSPP